MIAYKKYTLENGLRLLVHEDASTELAVVNILYNVGSRDEAEEKTGFAHLFEHLMFGGSKHAPRFDEPLQEAGGTNNAFTSPDITNYYDIIPAVNLETALWLEADRMQNLNIDANSLEVQRKVVIEEFKENYINQPYGDIWHKLMDLSFKEHPYKWPTIGKIVKHIEDATLEDVKAFFDKHYCPANAIMTIAGGVKAEDAKKLVEKWFGHIPSGEAPVKNIPQEPMQIEKRVMEHTADVPVDAIYRSYHMSDRISQDYYVTDLISDVLSNGDSSRFHQSLIKEKRLFSDIDAFLAGSRDPGLFVIAGFLSEGVSYEEAEFAIDAEIDLLIKDGVGSRELEKVKNKVASSIENGKITLLNKAMNLTIYENYGSADMYDEELDKYLIVKPEEIQALARTLFKPENSNTLYYKARKS